MSNNEKEEEKKKKKEKAKEICKQNQITVDDNDIKELGSGSYGTVYKIRDKTTNRLYALKIIFKVSAGKEFEEKIDFRGPNIVKILFQKDEPDVYYYLMECSTIGSLEDLLKDINNIDKNRVFQEPFDEKIGDNLIRYFASQLINAIKSFYQSNSVHYDIKPTNILIFKELQIKLIDFSFLTKIKDDTEFIVGGTKGYLTPEYYAGEKLPLDILQKQDYFAIGAVLYYLKYGEKMLQYNEIRDEKIDNKGYINSARVSDLIYKAINRIQSEKLQDKGFTDFLIKLIQNKPEDRPNFEEIYRNKWLNRNKEEIKKIKDIFFSDEGNIITELQKSDFLINNKKYFRKYIDKEKDIKNYKIVRRGKFKFGKKN